VLAAFVALGLIPATAARSHLERARGEMEGGKRALLASEPARAEERFRAAEGAFINARAQASNPILRVAGYLPILGRTPDAVWAMSDAGWQVARAGEEVSASLAELPGGLASLAPRDGVVPIEPLERLAPSMERAWVLARDARAQLGGSPDSWLLGPVGEARRTFAEELATLEIRLHAAAVITDRLPGFLGRAGTRRYFLGASNPAELRGSGGFIGAYAILTADRGRIRISDFRPIETLPGAEEEELSPPNPDYAERYPRVHGVWRNINITPDFPSAAEAIENLYAYITARKVDGVILADPMALQALMAVTGGVDVPELGTTLTPENVVAVLSNEAYATLEDARARKVILGDAAQAVLERFLEGDVGRGQLGGAARSLANAAAGGHLLLHSTDADMQRGLELAGVTGGLLPVQGDYLSVVVNNGAGNKLDYYAERRVMYRVHLGAEGTGRGDIEVEIDNTGPRKGQPIEVIGPYQDLFEPGENASLLYVFLPGTAYLRSGAVNGETFRFGESAELGHFVVDAEMNIPSRETGRMTLVTTNSRAWTGFPGGGVYRLTFQGQTTILPTEVIIDVQVPDGTRVVRATPGMEVTERRAVWTGVASPRMTFEVEFQKPFLPRAWDALTDFFGKRVVSV
jgi:hypothetical protein